MEAHILAVILYTVWATWVISHHFYVAGIQRYPVGFVLRVFYRIAMVSFIVINPMLFFVIGSLASALHCLTGVCMVLLRPEVNLRRDSSFGPIRNYWVYILVDSLIIVSSFLSGTVGG